jgi:hypothetical protein
MADQYLGLIIMGGIGLAMMVNTGLKKFVFEKEEWSRPSVDERLNGVTERPVYNENMEYRHSIGGSKKTKKNTFR